MSSFDMNDHDKSGGFVVRMAMTMAVMVVIILGVVLYMNRDRASGHNFVRKKEVSHISESDETEDDSMKPQEVHRTSDELDIWDEDYTAVLEVTPEPETEDMENDVTRDGNHTMITYRDGTTAWVTISNSIARNEYQDASFVYQKPVMKYYEDGKRISYMGVMVEASQRYVDYVELTKADVDFVMICVGGRDPGSGLLKKDAQFAQNMKNALDQDLQVGVWFSGQAKDADEAKEEAEFVLEQMEEYEVTYPVAYITEASERATRADELDQDTRTENAITFMDTIAQSGYGVMLGANKEYLIQKYDLRQLEEYDIWLMQPGDVPDYPYAFSMWTYEIGSIEGIASETGLLISMKDLGLRIMEK